MSGLSLDSSDSPYMTP